MSVVIRFDSRLFDPKAEPENPINPIAGFSLLEWLSTRVPAEFEMTDPDTEDWGWYSHVVSNDRHYMVGASCNESDDGNHEWVLQIDKPRTISEKLLGREKMGKGDFCASTFERIIRSEPAFTKIDVESGV